MNKFDLKVIFLLNNFLNICFGLFDESIVNQTRTELTSSRAALRVSRRDLYQLLRLWNAFVTHIADFLDHQVIPVLLQAETIWGG